MAIIKKKILPAGGGSGGSMGSAPNPNRAIKANPGGMEMMNTNLNKARPQNPSMGYKPPSAAKPQNPSMGYNRPVTNTPPRVGGNNRPVSSTPAGGLDRRTSNPRPKPATPYQAPGMGYVVNKPKPPSGRSPGVGTPPAKPAPRMKSMPVSKPKSKIPDYLNPALRKKKVVKKPMR